MINFFPVEKCFRKIVNFSVGKMFMNNGISIVPNHFSHGKFIYFSKENFYRKINKKINNFFEEKCWKNVLFFQDFSTKKLFCFSLGKMCGHLECLLQMILTDPH